MALLGLAAADWALHSAAVQARLLHYGEARASAALGLPVTAASFTVSLHGLSPELTLHGLRVGSLLQVPQLAIEVHAASLRGLLRRQWTLQSVRLDEPTLRLICDAAGNCNLPRTTADGPGGGGNGIFQLGVHQVAIHDARVIVDDRAVPLDADLRDLDFATNRKAGGYAGTLQYAAGSVQYGTLPPLGHALALHFTASPAGAQLTQVRLSSAPAELTGAVNVTNFGAPRVSGDFDLRVEVGAAAAWLRQPAAAGTLRLRGSLAWAGGGGRPALDGLTLRAALTGAGLAAREADAPPITLTSLAAQVQASNGALAVSGLRVGTLGGEIDGGAQVTALAATPRTRADLELRGLQLAGLARLARGAPAPVNGTLGGTAEVAFAGAGDNLSARLALTARGQVAAGRGAVPFTATLAGNYDGAARRLQLAPLQFDSSDTRVTANGTLGRGAEIAVRAQAGDLSELGAVAALFSPQAAAWQLAGEGGFAGTIRGTTEAPQIAGSATASGLHVRGTAWRTLSAQVAAGPQRAGVSGLQLVAADGGSIGGDASLTLRDWNPAAGSQVDASLRIANLEMGALTRAAGLGAPVTGRLGGTLEVAGTLGNPRGEAALTLRAGAIAGEPYTLATLHASGDGSRLVGELTAQIPAGTLTGHGSYAPATGAYTLQMQAPALQLGRLQNVATRLPGLQGEASVHAAGSGTLANPQLQASLTASELRTGPYAAQAIAVEATVANHGAQVTLQGRALNTALRGSAQVTLAGEYPARISFDTGPVPLALLVALATPGGPAGLSGETRLELTAAGSLRQPSRFTAALTVPEFSVTGPNGLKVGATAPIHADYAGGVLTLAPARLQGSGTQFDIAGRVPLVGAAPMQVTARGSINLELAQLLAPDLSAGGLARLQITASGAWRAPVVQGTIEIVNASFRSPTLPVDVESGNASLAIDAQRIAIRTLTANVGGGSLTASGGLTYRPALSFDLGMQAQRVRLLEPAGMRDALSADLSLTGNTSHALLAGRVTVDQIALTPGTDLTDVLGAMQSAGSNAPSTGPADKLQLDVSLNSSGTLRVISPTASLSADANLRVTGTASDPVLLGRLDLTQGDAIFEGHRYVLQSGSLVFANPISTEPAVDLTATTSIEQYDIQLSFRGPTDRLNIQYTSDPSLPQADIINLLAFGSTTEASGANPTPAAMQAENAVASQLTGEVTGKVQNVLGLSQLSVDPELGNTAGSGQGARITVQKRVTGDMFVTFSTDTSGTQREVIEVQYQLSPRVSLTAVRDENGGFALLTSFKRNW